MTEDELTGQTTFDEAEIEQTAITLTEKVDAIESIDSPQQHQQVGSYLKTASDNIKAITKHMAPQIEEAHNRHKRLTSIRCRLLKPFEEVKRKTSDQIADYQHRQENIRREAERKAQEEARKKAEEERLAQAEALEKEGQSEAAEHILDAPLAPEPTLPVEPESKVDGVFMRDNWKAELIDLDTVIAAAAKGEGLARQCLTFNQKAADGLAKALKANMTIPGVRAVNKQSVVTRTA